MKNSIRYWLALGGIKGVGCALMRRLLEHFNTPEAVFAAPLRELLRLKGIREQTARDIADFDAWEKIDGDIKRAEDLGIAILTWEDDAYPSNLLNIHDPPPLLYMLGEIVKADSLALAVVGSRNASTYGLEITENFCYRLAKANVTVISGGARGVDSIAHRGALKAGGRTVAVMGCGLDIVYPGENRELFGRIQDNGALLSEFPIGTPPDPGNFPRRNRIISGLSLGVLVVEASLKSGSLITARCALEHGREVYAIPGGINSMRSRGANSLIKEGARLVESPEEILEDILPQYKTAVPLKEPREPEPKVSLNEKEDRIFSLLGSEPMYMDQIVKKSMMDASEVSSLLLQLELMGAVKQHPGKLFTKAFR